MEEILIKLLQIILLFIIQLHPCNFPHLEYSLFRIKFVSEQVAFN
jgi:hypothetical protein